MMLRLRVLIKWLTLIFFLGTFFSSFQILLQSRCVEKQMVQPPPVTIQEYLSMKANLSQLQSIINDLQTRNHWLENRQKEPTITTTVSTPTLELDRPSTHKLAQDIDLFAELVTVILYRDKESSFSCTESQQKHLRQTFPKLKILHLNTTNPVTIGAQFNSLISQVNTSYFLFLNSRHELADHSSDHSVGWLLHALENVLELDIVSGSLVNHDKLEIPCYRMNLCNWTFSERYEYRRSIGELMICENIASSFMGRVSTIERIQARVKGFLFDEKLTSLSTTDFMLTVKQAGSLSGVLPEVFFQIQNKSKCKANKVTERRQKFRSLLPFAHKHKVFRFRHQGFEELDLCDIDSSPILGEDICDESVAHQIMLKGGHWAYDGTFAYPFIINNLQRCMSEVVDYLTWKKVPFEIEGGVALGAVKMRGILPWDAGDVDMLVYNYTLKELSQVMSDFARTNNFTVETSDGILLIFCAPAKLARKVVGLVTIIPRQQQEIPRFIKIKTNGRWLPYRSTVFRNFRHDYGSNYLQHKLYHSQENIHCKKAGHNACLPDFRRKNGQSSKVDGSYRELFCET